MVTKAFVTRHAVPTYFALTFAISWGGALLAIGGSGGIVASSSASWWNRSSFE